MVPRYFADTIDYPGADLLDGPEAGTFYQYVPSHFLRWAKMLVDPCATWVLERYQRYDPARIEDVIESAGAHGWIDWGKIDDDVIIVGKVTDRPGSWMVMWFDRDTSDCSIGLFTTADDPAVVVAEFQAAIAAQCDASLAGVERESWEHLSGAFRHDDIGPRFSP